MSDLTAVTVILTPPYVHFSDIIRNFRLKIKRKILRQSGSQAAIVRKLTVVG
jgi:hypothetical protein